jgi:L-threonylcarbamoyladenylate synthase
MNHIENDIKNCIQTMANGGIFLYPTDTIWGIGCDARDANAIQKIYQLKNREEKKSMIILVSDGEMLQKFVKNPSQEILNYLAEQNRPTTAIFENAINLPSILIGEDRTIAIRITNDEFCNSLIRKFKKPIISTSANISHEKFPQNFKEVGPTIKNGVDYIVQHRQNDLSKSAPSSIIKIDEEGNFTTIR